MLQELGLDPLSEQVYLALLEEPALEWPALARTLGLPQAPVGAALDQLKELTLLRRSRQDPDKWYPVPLERCIAELLRRQEAELEARRKALLDGKATAAAVAESAARRRGRLPAGVELVTELDDVQNLLESLLQTAETEIYSMVPYVMSIEALESSRYIDEEILRKGVRAKLLCHEGIRSNPAALAYEHDMLARGAQVRTAAVLPIRLVIVDRTSAVLPFDPEKQGGSAILTTAPGMVKPLLELFDHVWEDATPLADTPVSDEVTGLTGSETELLKILAGGLTDEAAAKRLGVSVRTVKRRMEDLMRRLEAGSRFEAGYRAAKRGWL